MRIRSLLLFLAFAAFGTPSAALAGDPEIDASNAFFDAGYSYCDAVHIGEMMGGDAWQAKVRTGGLILKKKGSKASQAVQDARSGADARESICEYDINYTYDDAEALAALWGMDTWQAKVQLSSMVRNQGQASVDEALTKARSGEVPVFGGESDLPEPEVRTALYAGYDACDAALLAAFWNVGADAALTRIGATVASDGRLKVEQDLAGARKSATDAAREACGYFNSEDYGYNDAEFLAALWGMEVYDAKMKIGELRVAGKNAYIRSLLDTPRGE
jgi:hypothetical protein